MELEVQKMLFDRLAKEFNERDIETQTAPGNGGAQVGDTLRLLIPVNDEGDAVLMEIMLANYFEDMDLLQFYSTLLLEIGPGYDELKNATFELNFFCPIGAFGIYEEGRQYYHKYGLMLETPHSIDELTERTLIVMEGLYDVISKYYQTVVDLSNGENAG